MPCSDPTQLSTPTPSTTPTCPPLLPFQCLPAYEKVCESVGGCTICSCALRATPTPTPVPGECGDVCDGRPCTGFLIRSGTCQQNGDQCTCVPNTPAPGECALACDGRPCVGQCPEGSTASGFCTHMTVDTGCDCALACSTPTPTPVIIGIGDFCEPDRICPAPLLCLIDPPHQARVCSCVGDCNGNAEVTVDEILTLVNVVLGNVTVSVCPLGDANGDGQIDISEILQAVNNALHGCGVTLLTPTPTPQCSSVPCGGDCAICPPCTPGTICPEAPCPLGVCELNPLNGCQCQPAQPVTPTPSPVATATLASGQCRWSGNCDSGYQFCLEPGGFLGCGICYPDSIIDESYHRCSTDADCHALGDSEVCTELGLASATCSPCNGFVSVCMQGCSGDEECGLGQICEQQRCVGSHCSNDQQCLALFTCALAGDGATSRCMRRPCTTDTDCGDGFCVAGRSSTGLCYSELGQCVIPPA
jgi:hypothetical protein